MLQIDIRRHKIRLLFIVDQRLFTSTSLHLTKVIDRLPNILQNDLFLPLESYKN